MLVDFVQICSYGVLHTMSIIEIENISFRYLTSEQDALKNVSLSVDRNEMVLLLGASGSGKSSLVLCLNGLIPNVIHGDFCGEVRVNGRNTSETTVAELATQVGMVFQDPEAQIVTMKVEDEIAFGIENLCLDPSEMEKRIVESLQTVGLLPFRKHSVDVLSGGQKQRLALASVLCMEPQIIILDEPTAYLDPVGTKEFFAVLQELKQSGNYTIIIIEHKLDGLIDMVDRVVVLGKNGSVLTDGAPAQVFYENDEICMKEGVWMPQTVKLLQQLKRGGLPITRNPLTIDETVHTIEQLLSRMESMSPFIKKQKTAVKHEPPILAVHKLPFTRDSNHILQPMELMIPKGDFLAIVGKNGAGKSTLTRHLIHLQSTNKGVIYFNGSDVVDCPAWSIAEKTGYVFQNPEHQFVTNSVAEELRFSLKKFDYSDDEIDNRVEEMLQRFGLSEHARKNPFQLSHGEKRRLSVATMLISEQELLILDEPTFGQDEKNATELMELMKTLQQAGKTIIIISHDMELICEYADHVAVLKEGELIFHGVVQDLFNQTSIVAEAGLLLPPTVEIARRLAYKYPSFTQSLSFSKLCDEIEARYKGVFQC